MNFIKKNKEMKYINIYILQNLYSRLRRQTVKTKGSSSQCFFYTDLEKIEAQK